MRVLRFLRTRWLGAAVLLAVIVVAACGDDAIPEPTPAPMPLEDLRITSETTGQELIAHISEAEASCLSSAMGDANFQLFQEGPLIATAATELAYSLFANCLENDSLLVLRTGMFLSADPCPRDASGLTERMIPDTTDEQRAAMEVEWVADYENYEDSDTLAIAWYKETATSREGYILEQNIWGDCRAVPGVQALILWEAPQFIPTPLYPTPTATPPPTATTPILTATPTASPSPAAMPTQNPTTTPKLTWHGLIIDAENRCSPYDPDDYPYRQSVEARVVEEMGDIIYGPYTGRWFSSTRDTDIEHIVARSEAHDSGLCAADAEVRNRFASDLLNLTLASPEVNRHQKRDKDAAEWLPDLNQCWFADRVIRVRLEYGLTIDQEEADALDAVLSECSSFEMVVVPSTVQASPTPTPESASAVDALALWDDDGNGRISCAEAWEHGIAPVRSDHPAYTYMDDRDGDGVVCE